MRIRLLAAATAFALVTGCATRAPQPAPEPPAAEPAAQLITLPETYVSDASPADELDSLATWVTEDGRTWLIASAKASHRLVVFDADSGERVREVGMRGNAPGQFNRPNGLAVHGDVLFVVERDNRRVQALSLPDFEPLGTFGEGELRSPYGLWMHESEPGELDVYVTDSFMLGERHDVVPPLGELDERVRRYRIAVGNDGELRARHVGAFGDTTEQAALRVVESIAGDPAHDRLLVADESTAVHGGMSTLVEYTLDGRPTGRRLPPTRFRAQAEGVVLWSCPDGSGYWIAVDQLAPLTAFHLFDRTTLEPRGSFQGHVTAHTDGVVLHAASTPSFPGGALFAVHDDRAVTAFDLRTVAKSLALAPGCTD
ncbi:phytase [Cognatilysobacter bugurensis]|uniref:Phytase n=1 Tax=Cognatilysobacter bugurensis TaxID=543356 RepID=A0A918SYU1_9GAMM|nr:phytase [Lysobacter bugurensis]GHA77682.1 phytase [Lysobacter bugurensis]